jgi:hypothetical protein
MQKVLEIVEAMPEFEKGKKILDYCLAESFDVCELTNYEFNFIAAPNFGASEGIYLDCWLEGSFCENPNKKTIGMGTLKTLGTTLKDMQIMGELGGILTWAVNDYVNKNIDQFSPEGEKRRKYVEEGA